MRKTWYTIKDGKINRVQITREGEKPAPHNLEWKQSPNNNILHPETLIERYDDNMCYLTDEEWLAKQGKKDFRGRWYSKEKPEEIKLVNNIDETVDENEWTKEPPLEDEPYQFFDNEIKQWVVDTEKKERAKKQADLGRMKAEIENAERKQYRSWKAITRNEADDEDLKKFNAFESVIRDLRPRIAALEDELESA